MCKTQQVKRVYLYNAYKNNGFLNSELTFIIPVYKNMPEYVKLPSTQTGNLYYKLVQIRVLYI